MASSEQPCSDLMSISSCTDKKTRHLKKNKGPNEQQQQNIIKKTNKPEVKVLKRSPELVLENLSGNSEDTRKPENIILNDLNLKTKEKQLRSLKEPVISARSLILLCGQNFIHIVFNDLIRYIK